MKIGITARVDKSVIFTNGAQQNFIYLYQALKNADFDVDILCDTVVDKEYRSDLSIKRLNVDVTLRYDIIIQGGLALSVDHIKILRKMKKKVIKYCTICTYDLDIDRIIYNKHGNTNYNGWDLYNEIWITEQHSHGKEYLETISNCKVVIVPYIWDSYFIEKNIENGYDPRYKPSNEKKIAVLEPNMSMCKNCLVPVAILFNTFKYFKKGSIFCSSSVVKNQSFLSFINNMKEKYNSNNIYFENRYQFNFIFSHHANILLSYSNRCALNYTYLEALYCGIPLIHNSPYIKDVGYYYNFNNVNEGIKQVIKVIDEHDNNIEEYESKAKKKLYKYSPNNPDVYNRYKELLEKNYDFSNYLILR